MSRPEYDEDRESYAALADEMNDTDVGPWDEEMWDPETVAAAKRYAKAHDLRFPPTTGDYDRFYERQHS